MRFYICHTRFLLVVLTLSGIIVGSLSARTKSGLLIEPGAEKAGSTGMLLQISDYKDLPVADFLKNSVTRREECKGGWVGTLTYTKTFSDSTRKVVKRISGRGQDAKSRDIRNSYSARLDVKGSPTNSALDEATATINVSDVIDDQTRSVEMNLCSGKKELQEMSGTFIQKTTRNGAAEGAKAMVNVEINTDGTYRISVRTSEIKGKTGGIISADFAGQCRPKPGTKKEFPEVEVTISGENFSTDLQRADSPKSEHLSGSYSKTANNLTETLQWDLRKCPFPARKK